MPQLIDLPTARRIATNAALLDGPPLPPGADSVVAVARHFGGIQIDPTRTVERTQHLVLWSRIEGYRRAMLADVLRQHRAFEHSAFIVTPDRLPELRFQAKGWPPGRGDWVRRAREFMAANAEFRQSILDQLRDRGPLPSREINESKLAAAWESSGWTHGRNSQRMLEFMNVRLEVAVAGRVGQERLWDLAERVIPADAPRDDLSREAYDEQRVMRAMHRFGVATLREIRLRAYGLALPAARAMLDRLVEERRLDAVRLVLNDGELDAYALPGAVDRLARGRTTLLSPFDPLVYDRDRTERLFDFSYRLEMYVPKAERQFGHFVLPIAHDGRLVGRLDSERDRKTNELVVRRLHWEDGQPAGGAGEAVDAAVADLASFVAGDA